MGKSNEGSMISMSLNEYYVSFIADSRCEQICAKTNKAQLLRGKKMFATDWQAWTDYRNLLSKSSQKSLFFKKINI